MWYVLLWLHTKIVEDPLDGLFLSKRCVFLVVLCLTKVDIDPVHKWLSYITASAVDARIIIVGTSSDDKADNITKMMVIKSIFQEYKNIRGKEDTLVAMTTQILWSYARLCLKAFQSS